MVQNFWGLWALSVAAITVAGSGLTWLIVVVVKALARHRLRRIKQIRQERQLAAEYIVPLYKQYSNLIEMEWDWSQYGSDNVNLSQCMLFVLMDRSAGPTCRKLIRCDEQLTASKFNLLVMLSDDEVSLDVERRSPLENQAIHFASLLDKETTGRSFDDCMAQLATAGIDVEHLAHRIEHQRQAIY